MAVLGHANYGELATLTDKFINEDPAMEVAEVVEDWVINCTAVSIIILILFAVITLLSILRF